MMYCGLSLEACLLALPGDLRSHFLLDRSSNPPSFRVPLDVIATLELTCHRSDLLAFPVARICLFMSKLSSRQSVTTDSTSVSRPAAWPRVLRRHAVRQF